MEDDLVLKVKEKQSLEIIKYISIAYLIFIFFYALILGYKETILQSSFILVFAVIIDAINSGEMIVNSKGIKTTSTLFLKYSKICKLNLNNRILTVYTHDENKPLRFYFSNNEDYKQIQKIYRYIDSKVQKIEEETREHEEYVKQYL